MRAHLSGISFVRALCVRTVAGVAGAGGPTLPLPLLLPLFWRGGECDDYDDEEEDEDDEEEDEDESSGGGGGDCDPGGREGGGVLPLALPPPALLPLPYCWP